MNPQARKLSVETADKIRQAFLKGGISKKDLATRHGVSRSTVSRIVNLRIWKTPRCGMCGGLVKRLTVLDETGNLVKERRFFGWARCMFAEQREKHACQGDAV